MLQELRARVSLAKEREEKDQVKDAGEVALADRELLFTGYRVPAWNYGKVLEVNCGDGCTTV